MMQRGEVLLVLAASAALVLVVTLMTAEGSEGRTIFVGDVVVDHDITWYDDTFEVRGNVTVLGGVHLTILEATLEIVGDSNGSHWFNASAGSTLTVDKAIIKGSPYPVGIMMAGICHMVDSGIENVWTSNSTPAMEVSGAMTMLRTTVEGAPDSTGLLVTGSLEAESCEFRELGDISLRFTDPTIPGTSSVRNCTFEVPTAPAGDTIALSLSFTSALTHQVNVMVDGCSFDGFTYGVEAFVNSSYVNLTFSRSDFVWCSTGLTVSGNEGRTVISDCTFNQSTTVGLHVYVLQPMLRPLDVNISRVSSTNSGTGIYLRGPVLTFKPSLREVYISGCTRGIQALGATVYVEDSVVIECDICFYVESKARIEIRRTEHTYRSADIAPAQQAAVVAFSTVEISSCWWSGAHQITEGTLFLHGDDGIELVRVEMEDLGRMELVVWSLTRFNDLGRLWVVPSIRQDGHEFTGLNFSIYNDTPLDLQIVDHMPPVLLDVWPPDGHWLSYSEVNVTGRLVENGSGLESLLVRLDDGQESTVDVLPDGNWSVVFGPVAEGPFTIEALATDLTGGTTVLRVEDLMVDVTEPAVQLFHNYTSMKNGTLLIPANDVSFAGVTESLCEVNARVMGVPDDSPFKCNETVTSDDQGGFAVDLCPGAGYHTLVFTSTDRAGNTWTMSLDIAMDAAPPAIEVTEPRDIWDLWHDTSSITVKGNVTDPGLSEWYKVWVNGVLVEVPGGVLDVTVDLEEGESHIKIEAEDQAGHRSQGGVTVRVDTLDPDLTIVTPTEDVFFTTQIKIDLQGEVSDENLETLTMNGQPLSHVEGLFTKALTIDEGDNTFLIVATDLAGNIASRTLVITKDMTPPRYTLDEGVSEGEILDVDGERFATALGGGEVRLVLTFTVSEHTTITASGGYGRVTGEGEMVMSIDLEEGENTVTFTFVDDADNAAPSLTYRITLDTTPPEIEVPGSEGTVRTKDRTHWLMGRVEEGPTLTLDGAPVKVNADGSFSTQVDLAKGENVFHLEAIDRVGLESSMDVVVERQEKAEESPGVGPSAVVVAMAMIAAMVLWTRRRRV
jgi:hypothetical protein